MGPQTTQLYFRKPSRLRYVVPYYTTYHGPLFNIECAGVRVSYLSVAQVAAAGPALAWVTYPDAIATLPYPLDNIVTFLFFLMMTLLAVGTEARRD